VSDRQVRFSGDCWQEIEALPQPVRWAVQRVIFHLLEGSFDSIPDAFCRAAAQIRCVNRLLGAHLAFVGSVVQNNCGLGTRSPMGQPRVEHPDEPRLSGHSG